MPVRRAFIFNLQEETTPENLYPMFQYYSSMTMQFYNVKHSNKMDTILFQVFKDQINIELKTSIQTLTFGMRFQV